MQNVARGDVPWCPIACSNWSRGMLGGPPLPGRRGVSGADVQALVVWSRAERAEDQRGPERKIVAAADVLFSRREKT